MTTEKKLKGNRYLLALWALFLAVTVVAMYFGKVGQVTGYVLTAVGVLGIISCVCSLASIRKRLAKTEKE